MGCVSSNSWLDFGDDPDRDADTGIFKGIFYHCEMGDIQRILLTTREPVDKRLWILWEVGRFVSNKSFYFGADPDHDPDPGILSKFLPLRDRANWEFAGPAAFGEGLHSQSVSGVFIYKC